METMKAVPSGTNVNTMKVAARGGALQLRHAHDRHRLAPADEPEAGARPPVPAYQQDKRRVIPMEMQAVDQWRAGVSKQASGLRCLVPVTCSMPGSPTLASAGTVNCPTAASHSGDYGGKLAVVVLRLPPSSSAPPLERQDPRDF
jgi:hypothetical protein